MRRRGALALVPSVIVLLRFLAEGMVVYRAILPKPGKAHRVDHLNPQTME